VKLNEINLPKHRAGFPPALRWSKLRDSLNQALDTDTVQITYDAFSEMVLVVSWQTPESDREQLQFICSMVEKSVDNFAERELGIESNLYELPRVMGVMTKSMKIDRLPSEIGPGLKKVKMKFKLEERK
jgi:hypothetical protein